MASVASRTLLRLSTHAATTTGAISGSNHRRRAVVIAECLGSSTPINAHSHRRLVTAAVSSVIRGRSNSRRRAPFLFSSAAAAAVSSPLVHACRLLSTTSATATDTAAAAAANQPEGLDSLLVDGTTNGVNSSSSRSALGVSSILQQLQRLCLSNASGDGGGGDGHAITEPMWQQAIHVVFPSSSSSSNSTLDGNGVTTVVSLLEGLTSAMTITKENGGGGGDGDVPASTTTLIPSLSSSSSQTQSSANSPLSAGETNCVLEWLLFACVESNAPVPLTTAAYQSIRTLLHYQQQQQQQQDMHGSVDVSVIGEQEEEAAAAAAAASEATRLRIPWRAKGLHSCYAQYLLVQTTSAIAVERVNNSNDGEGMGAAPNTAVLGLFDRLFACLLLESAEDAAVAVAAEEAPAIGSASRNNTDNMKKKNGSGVRTVATSAAQQLLLLEGLRQLLRYLNMININNDASASADTPSDSNRINSFENTLNGAASGGGESLPMLSWLLRRADLPVNSSSSSTGNGGGGGSDGNCGSNRCGDSVSLPRVDELSAACLTRLAPTDSAQDGLLLYGALLRELRLLPRLTSVGAADGSNSNNGGDDGGVAMLLLQLNSRTVQGLVRGTTSSEVGVVEEEQLAERIERAIIALITIVDNSAERAVLFCELFSDNSNSTPAVSMVGSSQSQRTSNSNSNCSSDGNDYLSTALAFVRSMDNITAASPTSRAVENNSNNHSNSNDKHSQAGIDRFLSRAMLLPCSAARPFIAHASSPTVAEMVDDLRVATLPPPPPIAWLMCGVMSSIKKARDSSHHQLNNNSINKDGVGAADASCEWRQASDACVSLLQQLAPALDTAVVYFQRQHSTSSSNTHASHRQRRHAVKGQQDLSSGTQVFWFAVLRAACDGVFPSSSSSSLSPSLSLSSSVNRAPSDILAKVVLPFYHPQYWRRETVNLFVSLLDQWSMSGELWRVMRGVQRHEERFQRRAWAAITQHQHQHDEDDDKKRKKVTPRAVPVDRLYRPALSLASCDTILQHCLDERKDPRAAAATIKYMTLSLRVRKLARDQRSNSSNNIINRQRQHEQQQQRQQGFHDGDGVDDVADDDEDHNHNHEDNDNHTAGEEEEVGEESVWLSRIVSEYIPRVNDLFAEKGISSDGSWIEE